MKHASTIVQETVGKEMRTLVREALADYHLPVYAARGAGTKAR